MKMRCANQTGIGAIRGSVNTRIKDAEIIIDAEGDFATGIGDSTGSGNVSVVDSVVTVNMLAANPSDMSAGSGDLTVQNSTINSLVNNKRIIHN